MEEGFKRKKKKIYIYLYLCGSIPHPLLSHPSPTPTAPGSRVCVGRGGAGGAAPWALREPWGGGGWLQRGAGERSFVWLTERGGAKKINKIIIIIVWLSGIFLYIYFFLIIFFFSKRVT